MTRKKPVSVNLSIRDNGYGFSRHIHILAVALAKSGYDVHHVGDQANAARTRVFYFLESYFPRVLTWLQTLYKQYTKRISQNAREKKDRRVLYDVSIHTMHDHLEQLLLARQNVFIPHQEWFLPEYEPILASFDAVFCLTHYAQQLFSEMHPATRYIGFSGEDRFLPEVEKQFPGFFHMAGLSPYKGTHALLRVWEKHPEWPLLTVIQHPDRQTEVNADNIDYRLEEYLENSEIQRLQNQHGVHLCTSESEGFDHYIVEPMSAKSVVLTLDAPPMNELIQPDRGYLVRYRDKTQVGIGDNFFFDEAHFETVIEEILATDLATLQMKGERAREWYLENQRAFEARLGAEIERLTAQLDS